MDQYIESVCCWRAESELQAPNKEELVGKVARSLDFASEKVRLHCEFIANTYFMPRTLVNSGGRRRRVLLFFDFWRSDFAGHNLLSLMADSVSNLS